MSSDAGATDSEEELIPVSIGSSDSENLSVGNEPLTVAEEADVKPRVFPRTWWLCALAASSELANGFDIGAYSLAQLEFSVALGLTPFQNGVVVGMFNLVAAVGCLLAGPLSDAKGRRFAMISGNVLAIIGVVIVTCSVNFPMMVIGRVVQGLGAGVAFVDPELYAAELSPRHIRGKTSSFAELAINLGILLGYVVGFLLVGHWRWMLGLGVVTPVLAVLGQIFVLPESPRWLFGQGRTAEARQVLASTASYTNRQLETLFKEMEEELRGSLGGSWRDFLCPSSSVRQMMVVGWGVAFYQQANGSEGVVYFTPTILSLLGLRNETFAFVVTVSVGFFKTCLAAVGMALMDRLGRRPLLLISSAGVTVTLALLAIFFSQLLPNSNTSLSSDSSSFSGLSSSLQSTSGSPTNIPAVLAASTLVLFISFFSIGFGPLTGVMLAEVFPLKIRGRSIAVGWALNRLTSGLVALTFMPFAEAAGSTVLFLFFSAVAAAGLALCWWKVPETKGLSLEAIQSWFVGRYEKKSS